MISYQNNLPEKIISEKDFADLEELLLELSPCNLKSEKDIRAALLGFKKQPLTFLVTARDGEKIVGMALQVFIQNWFGLHSFIHDVVIKKEYRGPAYGIFEKISEILFENDKKMGAKYSDLTCGKNRAAAHAAYKKHGWTERESIPFRRTA